MKSLRCCLGYHAWRTRWTNRATYTYTDDSLIGFERKHAQAGVIVFTICMRCGRERAQFESATRTVTIPTEFGKTLAPKARSPVPDALPPEVG